MAETEPKKILMVDDDVALLRIVREALWDGNERKRLYHEAVDFLKLRSERWKWVRQGGDIEKTMIAVPAPPSASGND